MLDEIMKNNGGGGYNIGEAKVDDVGRNTPTQTFSFNPTSIDNQVEGNVIIGNIIHKDIIETKRSLETALLKSFNYNESTTQDVKETRYSNRILERFITKDSEDCIIYNGISDALMTLRTEDKDTYTSIVEELVLANLMYTDIYGTSQPVAVEDMRQAYGINQRKAVLLGILRTHLDGIKSLDKELSQTAMDVFSELEQKFSMDQAVGELRSTMEELNQIATAAVGANSEYASKTLYERFRKITEEAPYINLKQTVQQAVEQRKAAAAGIDLETVKELMAKMELAS